jgi:hypothetical protein
MSVIRAARMRVFLQYRHSTVQKTAAATQAAAATRAGGCNTSGGALASSKLHVRRGTFHSLG